MTKAERRKVGRLQNLSGILIGLVQDDRNPNRMDQLVPKLNEMFELCISLLSKYPPTPPE